MNTEKTVYLNAYQQPDFLIDRVVLVVTLSDDQVRVHSTLTCRRHPQARGDAPLVLHGTHLHLEAVALAGQLLTQDHYTCDASVLCVPQVPDQFLLTTMVVLYPLKNTSLEGLYLSKGNYCTQCEPHGFRRITYFLDRPDVMARFNTTIIANKDRYPVLLSNGNPIKSGILPDGNHWVMWDDPSLKPCYLFALVAGDYAHVEQSYTTQSGQDVALKVYVEPGKLDQADFALSALEKAMRWDEKVYGRLYDLSVYMIVAVRDFNFGAMENKGLNIFNSKYILANPKVATDADYRDVARVIAHEYFHNWSGNRITCRDWFQITLKEGLTVFREQGFMGAMGQEIHERILNSRQMLTHQFAEDASPIAHPIQPKSYVEVNNFYTTTVYDKGAEVIRMLLVLLGAPIFYQGITEYFSRYDGQAVTTEHFIRVMEDVSHKDLTPFRRWYDHWGTPTCKVTAHYDEKNQRYQLTLVQDLGQTSSTAPFFYPVSLGLVDPETGQDIQTDVLVVDALEKVYTFHGIKKKPIPSLLRNFSAPVRVVYDYTEEELLFLIQHDPNLWHRWWCKEQLLTAQIKQQKTCDPRWAEVLAALLSDDSMDEGFLAQILTLPTERYLLQNTPMADPQAIYQAHRLMKVSLAKMLFEPLWNRYQSCAHQGNASQAISRRALLAVCLDYLLLTQAPQVIEHARRQYYESQNMTQILNAFRPLVHGPKDGCQDVLQHFYERWSGEDLVLDYWFQLQASAPWPDILAHVQHLMTDRQYQPRNPNRVRALVGSFAGENGYYFHQKDGSGYNFLADEVLKADAFNPSLAARLVTPLTHWRGLNETHQGLIRVALERIMCQANLSTQVSELVSQSLSSSPKKGQQCGLDVPEAVPS